MHYRQYIATVDDRKQSNQYSLVGLFFSLAAFVIALNIGDIIPFIKLSHRFKNLFTGFTFFAVVICLIAYLVCNSFREKESTLKLRRMNIKANFTAWKVSRRFNLSIIESLKLGRRTVYGLALPVIKVFIEDNCKFGFVAIENMQNTTILSNQKMLSDLSSLLTGRSLQRFAFISSELSQDENFYIFHFEDVTTSERLVINNNTDLKNFVCSNPSDIRLAKNLVWHTASGNGNLSIIGRTRSGKTVFSDYLLKIMKRQGWRVHYYSIKGDIYVEKYHGESDPVKIVESLETMVKVMHDRNTKIKNAGKTKYYELSSMFNIAVVLDEVSILNDYLSGSDKPTKELRERFNKAVSAIVSGGLSAGIHFIGISQFGTKDGYLIPKARTNLKDNVLILGLAADSADDRKYLMAGFDVPHRNYLTGQGVGRFVSSGKMWEQPHFYETPLMKEMMKD